MLKIGEVASYIVYKETDIAYMLKPSYTNYDDEIFLHFNQCPHRLNIGDNINAFLYFDQKKRLCATMETPLITTKKVDFCRVIELFDKMGVFINIGIAKDILLSSDYLPRSYKNWPRINDELPCLIHVKTNRLTAKIANSLEMPKEIKKLNKNETVEAIIYHYSQDGLNLITKDYNQIFVHKTLVRTDYHIGEKVNVKIININEKGYYNGTLIKNKEVVMFDDAKMILQYLEKHGHSLMLSDKSSSEEINKYFKISKSAFKRAIGNLYANHLITIKEDRILLNEE